MAIEFSHPPSPGPLEDIDKTAAAPRAANVPMKREIEGAPGAKLRQSATEAVFIDVPVKIKASGLGLNGIALILRSPSAANESILKQARAGDSKDF